MGFRREYIRSRQSLWTLMKRGSASNQSPSMICPEQNILSIKVKSSMWMPSVNHMSHRWLPAQVHSPLRWVTYALQMRFRGDCIRLRLSLWTLMRQCSVFNQSPNMVWPEWNILSIKIKSSILGPSVNQIIRRWRPPERHLSFRFSPSGHPMKDWCQTADNNIVISCLPYEGLMPNSRLQYCNQLFTICWP